MTCLYYVEENVLCVAALQYYGCHCVILFILHSDVLRASLLSSAGK